MGDKINIIIFLSLPPFGWLITLDWFLLDGHHFPRTIKKLKTNWAK